MGVAATQDPTFEWREVGAQVTPYTNPSLVLASASGGEGLFKREARRYRSGPYHQIMRCDFRTFPYKIHSGVLHSFRERGVNMNGFSNRLGSGASVHEFDE
jgi:hypothetical protein